MTKWIHNSFNTRDLLMVQETKVAVFLKINIKELIQQLEEFYF